MKLSVLLFSSLFILSSLTTIYAQNTPELQKKEYQFKYNFKDGQTFRNVINMHITTSASGNEKSFDLKLKEKISIKKDKDNNFIFTVKNESINGNNGIDKSGFHLNNMNIMEKGQKLVLKINDSGKILKFISKPFKTYQYSRLFEFPARKIPIGEYFKRNQTSNAPKMGFVTFKTRKKLEKIVDKKMAYFSSGVEIENSSRSTKLSFLQKVIFDMTKGYVTKGKVTTHTSNTVNNIKTKADVEIDWESTEIFQDTNKKKYDL